MATVNPYIVTPPGHTEGAMWDTMKSVVHRANNKMDGLLNNRHPNWQTVEKGSLNLETGKLEKCFTKHIWKVTLMDKPQAMTEYDEGTGQGYFCVYLNANKSTTSAFFAYENTFQKDWANGTLKCWRDGELKPIKRSNYFNVRFYCKSVKAFKYSEPPS